MFIHNYSVFEHGKYIVLNSFNFTVLCILCKFICDTIHRMSRFPTMYRVPQLQLPYTTRGIQLVLKNIAYDI